MESHGQGNIKRSNRENNRQKVRESAQVMSVYSV